MLTIFKEDRVTLPLYRPNRFEHIRRLRTNAEWSRATPSCPDRVPRETQCQASPHGLRGLLSQLGAVLREWRRRKYGRLALARFDERMLRDIGLTRVEAGCEINKPFWRE